MSPYTKKIPRRDLHLTVGSVIEGLGGYLSVAGLCMVSPATVNKWKQSPCESGQVIPLAHLQTLLAAVGDRLDNLALQNAADELVNDHLLSLFYRVSYPEEKVFQIVEMLQQRQEPPRARAANE